MKSSFTPGATVCGKDCYLQYLNVLQVTSVKDQNSSITQESREETTLNILTNILASTRSRLWMEATDARNTLDNLQLLEDDESFLIGSVLDNLLLSKIEEGGSESNGSTEQSNE